MDGVVWWVSQNSLLQKDNLVVSFSRIGWKRYIRSIILCIIATFGISGCSAVNKVGLKKDLLPNDFGLDKAKTGLWHHTV